MRRFLTAVLLTIWAASSACAGNTAIQRPDNDLAAAGETEGEKVAVPAVVAAKTGASDAVFAVNAPRELQLFLAWKGGRVTGVLFNPKTGNVSETPLEIDEEFLGAGLKAANRQVLLIERPYVSFMESQQDSAIYLLIKRAASQGNWSAGQTFVYRLGSDLSITESFCLETTSCPCALEKSAPCIYRRHIRTFSPNEVLMEVEKECDDAGPKMAGSFSIDFSGEKLKLVNPGVTEKESISILFPVISNSCSREAGISMIAAPGRRR